MFNGRVKKDCAKWKYKLRSLVVHVGGKMKNNGHYITYKLEGTDWWKLNDSGAAVVLSNNVFDSLETSKNWYILFYERELE